MKRTFAKYAVILAMSCGALAHEQVPSLDKFLKETAGLSDVQVAEIHRGNALAKVLDSSTPDQVMVFGIVYVESSPAKYLQLENDFDTLRKLPGYLAIQKFS